MINDQHKYDPGMINFLKEHYLLSHIDTVAKGWRGFTPVKSGLLGRNILFIGNCSGCKFVAYREKENLVLDFGDIKGEKFSFFFFRKFVDLEKLLCINKYLCGELVIRYLTFNHLMKG